MIMGMQIIGLDAVGRLKSRLLAIHHMGNALGDLMEHWERIMEDGNTQGVLDGLDKDGNPAPPVTYRPKRYIGGYMVSVKGAKLTVAQRLGQRGNKRRGEAFGRGAAASGWNNNLTTKEYMALDGPRLAPRRQFSRVITNFTTGHYQTSNPNVWVVTGSWPDVVTTKGDKFLHYHFDGDKQALYDLRGVRPNDIEKCKESFIAWAKLLIRKKYKDMPLSSLNA